MDRKSKTKTIKGFGGQYSITSDGRVWSHRFKKWLKITPPHYQYAYPSVALQKDCKTFRKNIHRLVALTYLPNLEELPMVNHKNGIKLDNRVENLEWCSGSHNFRHAIESGLRIPARGECNFMTKLTIEQVKEIRIKSVPWKMSYRKLARQYNVTKTTIESLIKRVTWKHVL